MRKFKVPGSGETALAASDLCQRCGLCCTGALFSHVSVHGKDIKKVEKTGIKLYERSEGKLAFDLACSKFKDGCCSIYKSRPDNCRVFYCILQQKVMNGSVTAGDGADIIDDIKKQGDWLLRRGGQISNAGKKGDGLRVFLSSYAKIMQMKNPKLVSQSHRDFIINAFEYLKLMDRHFHETNLLMKYAALIQSFVGHEIKNKKRT